MTWMARTATSKAETTFHTGDVAPDENAYRGQIGGQCVAGRFYAAPREICLPGNFKCVACI